MWPPFGKELLILFFHRSMFSLYYVYLLFFHFGFEGGTLGLIASVPGHCLPFAYQWTFEREELLSCAFKGRWAF